MSRTYVKIDLEQVVKNYNAYKKYLHDNQVLMAVVKADAYGHGDLAVVKKLYKNGVRYFAVASIEEAIAIRKVSKESYILILGYIDVKDVKLAIDNDITICIPSYEYAHKLKKYCINENINLKKIKCHIAIDTGMNRIGLNAKNVLENEKYIREIVNVFDVEGIFTHICTADTDGIEYETFTKNQINLFEKLVSKILDLNIKYIHYLNTASGIRYNYLDDKINVINRLGIGLYGCEPGIDVKMDEMIKPVLIWKCNIAHIHNIVSGDSLGYGRKFIAEKNMKIATITIGYADGYMRSLSNKSDVIINGKRCRVLGNICMDQTMVDVTDVDCSIGDEVTLIGNDGNETITATELAQIAGTINYEVFTNISKRVKRIYVGE